MSEAMDIDNNYDSRDRDASPRRDRPDIRDRSPRRDNAEYRDRQERPSKSDRNYSNSVFVGNIPFDSTPDQLKDLFQSVGPISRADIVTQNGRHRGMATVEFTSKEDVDKAIRQFNHTPFKDRDIFVRQDNPPPASRGGDRFGGRDSRDDRRGGFRDRDDRRGGYRDDRRGDDRRGGYRDDYRDDRRGGYRDNYRDDRRDDRRGDDRRADDRRGGYRDNYRDERRSGYGDDRRGGYRDERRTERPPRAEQKGPLYEVFVGNLPFRFKWQDLKDKFAEIGRVVRADVRTDYDGRSKGYGTVSFESVEDVEKAIQTFNGTEVDGRRIDVREGRNNTTASSADVSAPPATVHPDAHPTSEFTEGVVGNGEKSDTIYVSNLPFSTTNADLFELFESVGRVENAEKTNDSNGRPAAAVVKFESEDSAEAAITKLNQYDYGGRNIDVSYAIRP